MPQKNKHDYFISYSSRDRALVRGLVKDLEKASVRVWWDVGEMKPGDSIREEIVNAITQTPNFIIVLTPASLESSWVIKELNDAMLLRIEGAGTRVIPAYADGSVMRDAPLDLRGLHAIHLDKRNYGDGVAALVDLVRPEARLRKELLTRLRNPRGFTDLATLRDHALHAHDQPVEIAALEGLRKLGGRDALLAVTERSLDLWGVSSVERTFSVMARMQADGGLLALAASLLQDSRYFTRKLEMMIKGCPSLAGQLGPRSDMYDHAPQVVKVIYGCENLDIRYGTVLSHGSPRSSAVWFRHLGEPPADLLAQAIDYADERLPGLVDLLTERRRRTM